MTMTPPGPPDGPPPEGYGYVVPREHPQGTMILVFGILGIVGTCGVLGPVAWYMGSKALAEIDQHPGAYTNRGSVAAGRILGIITSVVLIIALIAVLAAMSVVVFSRSTSTSSING